MGGGPYIGKIGEEIAAAYLKKCGMAILERNYRTRFGEIDLICRDRKTVVFVEVKTRSSALFADPADAVDPRKIRRLTTAALRYMTANRMENSSARFDVLEIVMDSDKPRINHIKDAFDPADF